MVSIESLNGIIIGKVLDLIIKLFCSPRKRVILWRVSGRRALFTDFYESLRYIDPFPSTPQLFQPYPRVQLQIDDGLYHSSPHCQKGFSQASGDSRFSGVNGKIYANGVSQLYVYTIIFWNENRITNPSRLSFSFVYDNYPVRIIKYFIKKRMGLKITGECSSQSIPPLYPHQNNPHQNSLSFLVDYMGCREVFSINFLVCVDFPPGVRPSGCPDHRVDMRSLSVEQKIDAREFFIVPTKK